MAERTVAMLVGTMSDSEVAEATGMTSGEVRQLREERGIKRFRSRSTETPARPATQKLLRRKKGGSEVEEVFVTTTDEEDLPPEPVPPPVQRGGGRRSAAERLAAVRDQLGKLPDDVIADQVGLSRGVVGAYRRQHKIPAYEGYLFQKGHAPHVKKEPPVESAAPQKSKGKARKESLVAATPPVAAPVVVSAPTTERTAVAGRRGPRSRIEDHLDLLGVETDATVARLAGVTRAAVSAWRRARGISAAGAQPTALTAAPPEAAPSPVPAATPAPIVAPVPAPSATRAAPSVAEAVAPSAVAAFRMIAVADGAKLEFVAVGATMADACGRAQQWLAHRPGDWRLDEVRYLADAVL